MTPSFWKLDPEVPGGIGKGTILDRSTHPPRVENLHFVFDGWLGDDLLTSFPVYLVTARVREALEGLQPTGCRLETLTVTKSTQFMEGHFALVLPQMWWLRITGAAGVDDFGMSNDHSLVVSQRVLDCLRRFHLDHCLIAQFRA